MPSRSAWADYVPPDTATYPGLVPLFGVAPHTPASPCPHHGLLPDGTHLVCMVCHRTGAGAEARIAAVARREKQARINQPTEPDPGALVIKFQPKGGARGKAAGQPDRPGRGRRS